MIKCVLGWPTKGLDNPACCQRHPQNTTFGCPAEGWIVAHTPGHVHCTGIRTGELTETLSSLGSQWCIIQFGNQRGGA
jgi:hypothetical protein